MPIYSYKHPKTGKVKEIVQSMNEPHVYSEKGVAWERLWTIPQAAIDTKTDAFSQNDFTKKVTAAKGTIGDVWARSAEWSERRAAKAGGVDPIKEKTFTDYEKKTRGKPHPYRHKDKTYTI